MTEILAGLFADILERAVEALDGAMLWMLEGMLKIETMGGGALASILSEGKLSDLYSFIYLFACSLMILKVLFKGFEIYILWRNGDADNSPQDMLIGIVQAIVVIMAFPMLYSIMANATVYFADGIMTRFGLATSGSLALADFQNKNIFLILCCMVYLIMALVLCAMLMKRGFELLILRLGVPLACLGLLDSDYGVFKNYTQILFRTLLTSVIQVTLFSLSMRVMNAPELFNIMLSIAILMTAFGTPVLMQQLLIPGSRGGGVTNKIYSTTMAVKGIRSLIGK